MEATTSEDSETDELNFEKSSNSSVSQTKAMNKTLVESDKYSTKNVTTPSLNKKNKSVSKNST